MRRSLVLVLLALVLVGIGAFFAGMKFWGRGREEMTVSEKIVVDNTQKPQVASEEQATAGAALGQEQVVGVREIVVEGANFKFSPATITVKKGEKVRILFKSVGGTHDFVIDELQIRTRIISGGKEDFVEFTPDKIGEFEFYCSVGNHRQVGMVGKLVVQ